MMHSLWHIVMVSMMIREVKAHQSQVPGHMCDKVCSMVPNTCGPSVWNLFHVILLTHRILRCVLDFEKCVHLWVCVLIFIQLHMMLNAYSN
jgi:hypothetical protein